MANFPASVHVTPDVAAAYAAGALSDDELGRVVDHIDECSMCRQLLSHAAELGLSAASDERSVTLASGRPPPASGLPDGARVNRYVIDGRLGEGGMGVVYAARDPQLGRRVALKVLRAGVAPLDHSGEELLRREAMAMARLSHPNVVGVYDIFEDARTLFVAMELVEGTTLREWLRAAKRPWRDVLRAFLQAGRGLAAAHAEGIVHRDFKPDNVLVGGSGRVCVSDFGLSRMADAPAGPTPPAQVGSSGELSLAAGTPRYMSPEQRRGERANPRSDQFSFSVALYEGLYRRHPFHGPDGDGRAGLDWKLRPAPASSDVPAWLRRCVVRGLSPIAEDRYPTMDALLRDLADDPSIRRRRSIAAGVVAAGLAVATGAWLHHRHARAEACAHADSRLAGAWDAATRAAAAHAFDPIGTSFAHDTWRRIDSALGGYAARWVAAREAACRAVLAGGEPRDVPNDPAIACLEDRLVELRAVAGELPSVSTAPQVSRAMIAAESLRPVDGCVRPATPRATPPPADPARVREARDDLASARALGYFGKWDKAATLAERSAQTAQALGDDQLLGQALAQEGYAHVRTFAGKWEVPQSELERAMVASDRAGDDATRGYAAGTLVYLLGEIAGRPRDADRVFDQGMAALHRLGGDARLEMKLRGDYGGVLLEEGRAQEARDQFALTVTEAQHLQDAYALGGALDNLGQADASLGDLDRATEECDRAEAILGERLGETHVIVLTVLNNSAYHRVEKREFVDAVERARRAVAGYEASVGIDRLDASIAVETLAEGLVGLGRFDEAEQAAARSLAIREKVQPSARRFVAPLTTLGVARVGLGELDEAVAPLERALAIDGGDPEYVADARFALARALDGSGNDRARARSLATAALAGLDAFPRRTPLEEDKRSEIAAWLGRAGMAR